MKRFRNLGEKKFLVVIVSNGLRGRKGFLWSNGRDLVRGEFLFFWVGIVFFISSFCFVGSFYCWVVFC